MSAVGASFGERLKKVQDRIAHSRTSISAREIQILAVSKSQSVEKMQAAYAQASQKLFGENYLQEALEKQQSLLSPDIEWHFIGHLQSNKIKSIVGAFDLIHSVDRIELIKEIHKRAEQKNLTQKVLIEVNIADETSKSGIAPQLLPALLDQAKAFPRVKIAGLMCMPPLGKNETETRQYFAATRALAEQYKLAKLSMGTSEDFEWAVAEGATILRLGTILFGKRGEL